MFTYVPRDKQNLCTYRDHRHCFVVLITTGPETAERVQLAKRWCEDHLGQAGHHRLWTEMGGTFRLRRDKDAFAFRLRWC